MSTKNVKKNNSTAKGQDKTTPQTAVPAGAATAATQEKEDAKEDSSKQATSADKGADKTAAKPNADVDKASVRKASWHPTFIKQMRRCFENGAKVLYVTSDNQGFTDESLAKIHAGTLQNESVKTVTLKDI